MKITNDMVPVTNDMVPVTDGSSMIPEEPKSKPSTKKRILVSVLCLSLLSIVAVGGAGTYAYLSDYNSPTNNSFTVGDVVMNIDEDFEKPASLSVGTNTYKKDVKVTNDGTLSGFVRASLLFSSGDVEDISEVSSDGGKTWYSMDEFPSHLPSGWVYQSSGDLGGYYYYTKAIAPGASTTSLITNVRTTFQQKVSDIDRSINYTPRDYDIFVYAEGLQQDKLDGSGIWNDYSQAWTTFLGLKE